ncbi:MAG: hypothetical protein Q8Q63_15670 [Phaeovulum sp.]|uniref:hypothetical protein n=1 Tax=Phaeovulum sp. TaxID=2934796 RepID=UPI002733AF51|nr:hypothetical protein [Phaeovulum sp.]MDP3863014.1 hypothetical protein [Phaeovulum sp.]
MSSASEIIRRSALVGGILISTTLGAEAATVSRCSVLTDGSYVPALMVEVNGNIRVHGIGENGLTRSIIFDPDRAVAWARSTYGGAGAWVAGAVCDTGTVLADAGNDDDEGGGCGGL